MEQQIRSLPHLSSRETQELMRKNYDSYIAHNPYHKDNLKNGITTNTKGVWHIEGADQNDSHFSSARRPSLVYVKCTYNEAIIFACSLEFWNYWSNEGPGGRITQIQLLDIGE